jgi:hypothetical protein
VVLNLWFQDRKQRVKAIVVGDTSGFHQLAAQNFHQFCELFGKTGTILHTVRYDYFGLPRLNREQTFARLPAEVRADFAHCDVVIVHGEGLLESAQPFIDAYLHFGSIAKDFGIDSWLVNFCMYEPAPVRELLKAFSYIACRDALTRDRLAEIGLRAELSFDCTVLGVAEVLRLPVGGPGAAIRGREEFSPPSSFSRYECAWRWPSGGVHLNTFSEYLRAVRVAPTVLTSSYHGAILGFIAGAPVRWAASFRNPKFKSVLLDICADESLDPSDAAVAFGRRLPALQARARRNVPA